MIDAHHHLWDLSAVRYPWLEEKSVMRFFGDPSPIQKDYLIHQFKKDCRPHGFNGSIHIQVGAKDPIKEAIWVDNITKNHPDWNMKQVVFCDLTKSEMINFPNLLAEAVTKIVLFFFLNTYNPFIHNFI